ncbi:hypothetical protein AVEN_5456-1 [Araneus ventricosus]|uniref:Uncharacterized protein n=1 Tax=Araneus ventricosus TaxID=182803 RepID=A0A4Y2DXQ7_ARAVE|nr:hypothetical protein AVEN_5456-1 [Araneus ventricosus]
MPPNIYPGEITGPLSSTERALGASLLNRPYLSIFFLAQSTERTAGALRHSETTSVGRYLRPFQSITAAAQIHPPLRRPCTRPSRLPCKGGATATSRFAKALSGAQPESVPREFASTGYTRMRQTILILGTPPGATSCPKDALPSLRPSAQPTGLPQGLTTTSVSGLHISPSPF